MEILIVLVLIVINGLFAMAEIAIISSRKSKLQQLANEGNKNAEIALEIAKSPSKFLSTVQIGITLVGIFAGAFGGATIAQNLKIALLDVPILAQYSEFLSLAIVVTLITFLSLVIGELVPKRIALSMPERISRIVALPMFRISQISAPIVSLLSFSTDSILKLIGIKSKNDVPISDEEIRVLLHEGTLTGAFDLAEKDIVERTLRLGDKKVKSLMTVKKEIIWLDVDSPFKTIRNKITKKPHAHFPVCRDSMDKVVGIIRTEKLLTDFLAEEKINLKKLLHKPLFVPESMDCLRVLELFKKSGIHMALIVDEYGNLQGLITITDILEAIVGDIPTINELEEKEIVKRADGSFLVDGLVTVDEFKDYFKLKRLPGEKSGIYHTIGGLVTHRVGRIPVSGDKTEIGKLQFEVMDMDGNRVDKVLLLPVGKSNLKTRKSRKKDL